MRLESYPSKKLKEAVLKIVKKYLSLEDYHIFIFGSRVTGRGNERSDIDIGIEGTKEVPFEVMGKIRAELEDLPILYKIEIVDFKKVSKDFREVALKHIEVIS